ncbi:lytic polysaccharide monooxygenase auxiliary activity family 9 protein [Gilvimarinus agarilyticus]|uniref:lytic polysaccharide monooxygenase auxiliary activity family 9 protein n=1 Tax=Gilvimarinus agarilyticus TaxID=679259 RepID=UPI00069810EC|nr:lytic polysaccharide monooxygenase [Gilvimarinus agarilyticus]
MNAKWLSQKAFKGMLVGCVTVASLSATSMASAHGTITSPASRIWNCKSEGAETLTSAACQAAKAESGTQQFYDWNGIRQGAAGGNHTSVVPNGELCSGGDPGTFGGMDLARNDWVATDVGGSQTFSWYNSAAHATEYYRYYITKPGYDSTQPLGWDDLELMLETPPEAAEHYPSHLVNLPARNGRHVVYAVWQRSDSPEAFYACVDVKFDNGGGNSSSSTSSSSSSVSSSSSSSSSQTGNTCVGIPNWGTRDTYTQGDQVRYNDSRFEAKWWTRGDVPTEHDGQWEVWINQGSCAN